MMYFFKIYSSFYLFTLLFALFLDTVGFPLRGVLFFSFVPSCSLMTAQKITTAQSNKEGREEGVTQRGRGGDGGGDQAAELLCLLCSG